MAYREAPAVPGLPFPRKNLAPFTAAAIVVGACAFIVPGLFFVSSEGFRMFREGGWAMYLLVFFGVFSATALAALSVFVVRGKTIPAAVIAGIPAVTAVLGSVLAASFSRRMVNAVHGLVDPMETSRILAAGTGEIDSIYFFACLFSAGAFGAVSVAHLAAASTVDRSRHGAPPSGAWIASLALGIVALLIGIIARVVLRVSAGAVFLTLPSLVVVTTFATTASRNAAFARGWHDPKEADAWVTSILVAAISAATGVFLIDVAAALLCERRALEAISGASITSFDRVRILADGLSERRSALLCGAVDGSFAFAVAAAGLVAGLGRGPGGQARSPLRAPASIAGGAVALVVLALFGTRAWSFGAAAKAAEATPSTPAVDLPLVARNPPEAGYRSGSAVTVRADGTSSPPTIDAYSMSVILIADRRAKWADVAKALRTTLAKRREALFVRNSPASTALLIRVQTSEKVDRSALGSHAVFVAEDEPMLYVLLEPAFDPSTLRRVKPSPEQDMASVVAAIDATPATGSRALLLPPDGKW